MEINEKQTIKNAKKKLREYPRWREIAREQGQNEARQQWHDDQVEWGIQQGYLNPDGSPKETN